MDANYLKVENAFSIMAKRKYRIVIEQDEDGMFVVECPALPGCISQGKTRLQAVRNIKDAIKLYLKSLEEHGEKLPPSLDEETVEINA